MNNKNSNNSDNKREDFITSLNIDEFEKENINNNNQEKHITGRTFNFTPKKQYPQLDIKDYYKKPSKSKNDDRIYTIDKLNSNFKSRVTYRDNAHTIGDINLYNNSHTQKFPLYNEKTVNLNFIGLDHKINEIENDFQSTTDIVERGNHCSMYDLAKGIYGFEWCGIQALKNYKHYKDKINYDKKLFKNIDDEDLDSENLSAIISKEMSKSQPTSKCNDDDDEIIFSFNKDDSCSNSDLYN